MPAHRKSSLERYIPPRRSIDQQHNDNTTPSPSGGKKGPPTTFAELADRSFEALSWNEEVELDQNMKNMYIGSWADETEKQVGFIPYTRNPVPSPLIKSVQIVYLAETDNKWHSVQMFMFALYFVLDWEIWWVAQSGPIL